MPPLNDNTTFYLIIAAFVGNAILKRVRAFVAMKQLYSTKQIKQELGHQVEINNQLQQLMQFLSANRAALITYNPESKTATMLYERVTEGTQQLMPFFRQMPTSPIASLLQELEIKGQVEMHSDYHDKKVYELHKAWNIEMTVKYKLDKSKSIGAGCLVVSFAEDRVLSSNELDFIKASISTINNLYTK